MSKLVVTIPTGDIDILGEDITIERATELAVHYIHKFDLHSDIDIHYHTDDGESIPFDFETETFKE